MRPVFLSTILLTSFTLTSALAAESSIGKVAAIDRTALTLTLGDGSLYRLPRKSTAFGVRTGDEVTVRWDQQRDQRVARSVNIHQQSPDNN